MPTSDLSSFFDIMESIAQINAKTILDIGVGFGKWGFLIREYFDLRPDKKRGYDPWSIKLDGIEVHEKYLTPVHEYIYNELFIGEALEILSNNNLYYDLILALDVVEHFTKQDGDKFIQLCRNRSDTILINTPNIYYKINKEHYNEYMEHKSGWVADDFTKMGARYVWHSGIHVLAVFTEKLFDLPINDINREYHLDEFDLIKIKQLVNMYHGTGQYRECAETCEKYFKSFDNDCEFPLLAALCYEKLDQPEKARSSAEIALRIKPALKIAKEIIARNQRLP